MSSAPAPDLPPRLLSLIEESRIALSLADCRLPDCPLTGVSGAFSEVTGYRAEEAVGRNCRFLQPDGGAGPVRARMRAFIANPDMHEERFIVPNKRKDGEPFLNLVYMTKLRRNGRTEFILGSQFDMSRHRLPPDAYDAALRSDLRSLDGLAGQDGWLILGTCTSLASSHSIIAKVRFDD